MGANHVRPTTGTLRSVFETKAKPLVASLRRKAGWRHAVDVVDVGFCPRTQENHSGCHVPLSCRTVQRCGLVSVAGINLGARRQQLDQTQILAGPGSFVQRSLTRQVCRLRNRTASEYVAQKKTHLYKGGARL